jgi:methyl-accepting chemotaxis protein
MDMQYRYIIGALIFALLSVSLGIALDERAILVLTILGIAIAIFLIAEQRRHTLYFKERLSQKREEQQNLSNLLASEIKNMIQECEHSLVKLNSTQHDAVELISTSFIEMQQLLNKQAKIISHSVPKDSLEHVQVSKLANEIQQFVHESIRGMQFGDINTQNLQFCLDTLCFIREQIDSIGQEDLDIVITDIRSYLEVIRTRRNTEHNPVSSENMQAGEVEFF